MSESDTIQLAIPLNESDVSQKEMIFLYFEWVSLIKYQIKAVYIEKNPIVVYEEICKAKHLVSYSNIRLVLKKFFDKFELSLQRLSLKLEQAVSILNVFENFMFIYSINLSGNLLFLF